MGKYQLDNKGQKSVGKFHEKNSTVGGKGINTKNATQAELEANGTLFSTDIADIINDDSIDLVVIVTPAFAHYDYAKELLSAGKKCTL